MVSKEYQREYKKKVLKKDSDYYNRRTRIWKRLNPEKARKYYLKWEKKHGKKYIRKYQKRYRNIPRVKEKYKIRQYANRWFRQEIIKEKKQCEMCNSIENLELHHKEYNKNKEEIILLCRKCHRKIHIKS